ncbi:MAG: hypothetical protein P1V97_39215, partial [Planctomycetota bacterium]|nr:hypothetical protein [Planctomycetota bacterium]
GRLGSRLQPGGDLYQDLEEFNPIYIDPFMARWSKRHAKVRMAHILLGSALKDRQYVLEGGTDEARQFHEAWIKNAIPQVLEHVVDATWYGWQPFAIEWESVENCPDLDLHHKFPDAWIPAQFVDLDAFEVQPELDRFREVVAMTHRGDRYGPDQVFRMTWQQEGANVFGDGQAIVAQPWWKSFSLKLLWFLSYYERSVDPARLAWSRDIIYKIGGEEVPLSEIFADALDALGNGDTGGLPLEFDESGNPFAKLETLELPDRSDTFIKGLDFLGQVLYESALVLPGIGLTSQGPNYAVSRSAEKQQVAVLEHIGDMPIKAFNRRGGPIARAHKINGFKGPKPTLVANPFKREQLETLRELSKTMMNEPLPETKDGKLTGKFFRGHDLVDLEAADEVSPGEGGRPQEPMGDRADDRGSGLER